MYYNLNGDEMNIGEVSKKFNLSIDTLRYYENIGLIKNIKREHNIRVYSSKDLEQISFIECMKKSGFPLKEIVKFINLYEDGNKTIPKRIDMLLNQKTIILKEIKDKEETLKFLNYKINYYDKLLKEEKND
jgi:DNA-binding transcriptional MerR regulator